VTQDESRDRIDVWIFGSIHVPPQLENRSSSASVLLDRLVILPRLHCASPIYCRDSTR
jgi:hypothetical protein